MSLINHHNMKTNVTYNLPQQYNIISDKYDGRKRNIRQQVTAN